MTEVKRIKVLFVIDTLEVGGAEKSLLDNTSRFTHVHPVVCHIYKGDTLKQQFVEKGITTYSLNIPGRYNFTNAYKALSRIIVQEKPDVLVAYLTRAEIVTRLAGKLHHIPVIGTFVSDLYCKDFNRHLSWKGKLGVEFFRLINKWMSKICVGFVANSSAIKEANIQHLHINPDKIKVINRGRESVRIAIKEKSYPEQQKQLRFLNVGRLIPVKAQQQLIQAFARFANVYPAATLHIAGDGPLHQQLLQTIAECRLQGKVILLGNRKDIPTLLAGYDCFVFPSLVEGFSGSVVEAMFARLPVLASNIPQNREAITHLHTGYLFEKNSIKAIEEALFWFAGNTVKAYNMAEQAYIYAKQHFELKDRVEELETYLQSAI
ncbi:glycosyltransferase [Ilyomonas limi]|uniref:Glycosyltransferase n=1 Tax=Ilyomonas limi TaxID=2575867 RepID=A0A4U3KRQ2_9BACT|nr:glycosyltransferase [Ilyomonas limi]TKK65028.1 glycosyltransferase [Ilyomonas limi]